MLPIDVEDTIPTRRRKDPIAASFLGAFLRRASDDPDRVLFTLYKRRQPQALTHRDLLARARTYAAALQERGAGPGKVVLISLQTSPDLFGAFLGTLLIGAIPSFMPMPSAKQDPALFWGSHNVLFRHIGAALIVTCSENRMNIEANIDCGTLTVITADEVTSRLPQTSLPNTHSWQSDDIACLQHSSGTTGLKKGVALTFGKIEAQIAAYTQAIGIVASDTIVSWLPLYHDMGFIACFLMPLRTGNPVVMVDPFEWLADPLFLFELIERHDGRYVWMPNFAFNHLVNCAFDDSHRANLSGTRAFINCSEPCKVETFRSFAARFRSWGLDPNCLQICYALAEAVFAVTQTRIGESPFSLSLERSQLQDGYVVTPMNEANTTEVMTVGRPLPGVEIAIFDDQFKRVDEGKIGQIGLRGKFIFDGYYRDPERTRKAFYNEFYLTGDLGFERDGDLFLLGRQDDLIIVLGKNFFAHEIEKCVSDVQGVKAGRAVAFAVYNERIGSADVVIVAEKDGAEPDARVIRNNIRIVLEGTLGLAPKTILIVDAGWLVKSTSGKISRRENRNKYLSAAAMLRSPSDIEKVQ
jgi:acyl-CoA synthetase (AMP-forming)/AMP-acid ligase II